MSTKKDIVIFGEVLFDCFSSGDEVLGGAPFNVAWHLQAFGDKPKFISRVGQDSRGQKVKAMMAGWGMPSPLVQSDPEHPTGRVDVNFIDNEPHYNIVPDVAYDFIEPVDDQAITSQSILYHGSLALRQEQSKCAFTQLSQRSDLLLFVDVNLRSPWWNKQAVEQYLHRAQWAKLNHDELALMGFENADIAQSAIQLQVKFDLEQVIITQGEQGALVCTRQHKTIRVKPPQVTQFVDTVGAGDAFTARYIHGLRADEAAVETVEAAQKFSIRVLGLRGAISTDAAFYQ
jgi:fructokinase